LQLDPHNADLLNDYGVFHLHREQWLEAGTQFRRALKASPSHQRATTNLATTLAMQDRLQESFDTFTQIVSPAAAHSNLGVLLTRQGRTAEAEQQFQHALAIDATPAPPRKCYIAYSLERS